MGESVESRINRMALGFLFFADFLWPFLVPLASAFVEGNKRKQRIFLFFTFVGGLFGLSLFLPLLFQPAWLSVVIKHGSILYQLVQIYDDIIPQPGSTNYLRYYRRYTLTGFFDQKYSRIGSSSLDFDLCQYAVVFLRLCIRMVLFCSHYFALYLFNN